MICNDMKKIIRQAIKVTADAFDIPVVFKHVMSINGEVKLVIRHETAPCAIEIVWDKVENKGEMLYTVVKTIKTWPPVIRSSESSK